jgi:hypothetical protein
MNLGKILKKYRDGDRISDKELDYAINKLNEVTPVLTEIGETMYYSTKELRRVCMGLEDMKFARNKK